MGKSIYLIAALITSVIFLGVFVFVRVDEQNSVGDLSQQIQELYEEQQINKILGDYLEESGQDNCEIYEKQISRQLNKVYDLFYKLEKLKTNTFTISDQQVKRQYLITNMSFWLDLRKASKVCEINIEPILFFLPNEPNCSTCTAMIEQLEQLKTACPNVRVFAFPSEPEDFELVTLLQKDYNVSSFPSIVINDEVFTDIVDISLLKEKISC